MLSLEPQAAQVQQMAWLHSPCGPEAVSNTSVGGSAAPLQSGMPPEHAKVRDVSSESGSAHCGLGRLREAAFGRLLGLSVGLRCWRTFSWSHLGCVCWRSIAWGWVAWIAWVRCRRSVGLRHGLRPIAWCWVAWIAWVGRRRGTIRRWVPARMQLLVSQQ